MAMKMMKPGLKIYNYLLLLMLWMTVSGCRHYEAIRLMEYEPREAGQTNWEMDYQFPPQVRFYQQVNWKKQKIQAEGVVQRKEDGIYIAASSSSGLTLYAARWKDGVVEIMKNNLRMPDRLLRRVMLDDLLFFYDWKKWPPNQFFRSAVDNSIWAGNSKESGLYCRQEANKYIVIKGDGAGGIRYKATLEMRTKANEPALPLRIVIDNPYDDYSATLIFAGESQ